MRPLPILLLAVVVAAITGFVFLTGDSDGGGSVLPSGVDPEGGAVEVGELPDSGAVTLPGDGSQRTSLENSLVGNGTESADAPLDLTSIDANALVGIVVDAGGVGIAECRVMFLEGGTGAFSWKGKATLGLDTAPLTTTGSDGSFRFENLPPGDSHALVVHHPEIALVLVEGILVGDYGEFEEPPIVLRYGKRIRGQVINEFGLPLEGVQVHVDGRWVPSDPQPSVDRLSTTTDAAGKYEIFGVPDGRRCLTAEAPGYSRMTRIQSLILNDKTGDSHIVNLTLQSQAQLAGRVTDVSGQGIGGVELLAVDRVAYRDVSHGRAVSEPDGSFSFEGLGGATYLVTLDSPIYGKVEKRDVQTPIDNLNLILQARPSWTGSVVDSATQAPVANFDLRLRHYATGEDQPSLPKGEWIAVRGSDDGAFAVPSPTVPGTWEVEVRSDGYAPGLSPTFAFQPGSAVDGIFVGLSQGGAITGRLVDQDGQPVVGGRIESRDDTWTDDAFSAMVGDEEGKLATERSSRSATDGSFVLVNLRPAAYQLLLRSSQHHQVTLPSLEVAEGDVLDVGEIVLQPGAALTGALFDSESSTVTGGMVFLAPKGQAGGVPVRRSKSGLNGTFRFQNVVPGTYLLSAKPPQPAGGMLSLWPEGGGEEVVLAGGTEDQRDVHLETWTKPKPLPPKPPTGNVAGKLVDADGAPVTGMLLLLQPTDREGEPIPGKSMREGEFSFTTLPPGAYSLYIDGHEDTAVDVEVVADRWTRHDLTLPQ